MPKILLMLCVLAVTGCRPAPGENQLVQYTDKANGVVCYQDRYDARAFSCVKVSGGVGQ